VRVLRGVLLVLLVALLAGTTNAVASAQPAPPPNPSNDELQRSRDAVDERASNVARLTQRLSELQAEADDLQIQVAEQHEAANEALDVLTGAEAEADAAAARAEAARAQTESAGKAIDAARTRLDEFVAGAYSRGLDLGPIGLLTTATGPDDLVDRAQLTDALAQQQAAALDGLERARVQKANADSTARAAQAEAEQRRQAATEAKTAADQALAGAEQNAAAQAQRLSAVATEQQQVQAQLDAAEDADSGLRAQRQRFRDWQRAQEEAEAARQRTAQQEASARVGSAPPPTVRRAGSGAVQTVIDRAMAQLGVRYSWGGGNSRGPTVGVRDGGVADSFGDFRKVGFDCSGLMLYSFAGVGVNLPRWSGNQATFGDQVPRSQMQPGDMLSWARNGRTYHIALYIGNGKMIEAPYSGASVKVSPVRYTGGLSPTVSRVL
jgi:cell wall-associated NlpC family hydrolase